MTAVDLHAIRAAGERIAPAAVKTPLLPGLALSAPDGIQLWLKCESLQRTGSFKFRGAYNAVAGLSAEERRRGVITYSSGNHGQAVAAAAHLLGVKAVVTMPDDAVPLKVELTQMWGAEIVYAGRTSLSREARARELAAERGYVIIPPFDDPRIIAGQGTAGLEILGQQPELDAVVVQVGGGGLISGVATAIKSQRPGVRVIGVEPEGGADAQESFRTGKLTTWDTIGTVADGLRTSRIGELNFETIRRYVDDIVTVSDAEIMDTVATLANRAKLVVEPSGAVATAAVVHGKIDLRNACAVAVISGGNVDPAALSDLLLRTAKVPAGTANT